MNDVFLAVIAAAVAVMAAIQVAALVMAARAPRTGAEEDEALFIG